MKVYRSCSVAGVMAAAWVLGAGSAVALDLNGAWATDADNCAKVFVHKGAQVSFTDMSDVYGGGFIIEGDQITGKFARCRIKAKKDDGTTINLVAACASDIMLSERAVQPQGSGRQCRDPHVPGHGRHGDQIRALSGAVAKSGRKPP